MIWNGRNSYSAGTICTGSTWILQEEPGPNTLSCQEAVAWAQWPHIHVLGLPRHDHLSTEGLICSGLSMCTFTPQHRIKSQPKLQGEHVQAIFAIHCLQGRLTDDCKQICIHSGHDATTVFLTQGGLLLDDAHEPS